jgi:hypothetical protein
MTRLNPPEIADERSMLVNWLAFHRETVRVKCQGLTDDQMRLRSVPPATLSPLGMVRHLAEVEAFWWREVVEGKPIQVYCDEANRDADFDFPEDALVAEAWSTWDAQVAHANEVFSTRGLDDEVMERDTPNSIRWIMVHLIEEYARHNGHLDLLRQSIDGVTGE